MLGEVRWVRHDNLDKKFAGRKSLGVVPGYLNNLAEGQAMLAIDSVFLAAMFFLNGRLPDNGYDSRRSG